MIVWKTECGIIVRNTLQTTLVFYQVKFNITPINLGPLTFFWKVEQKQKNYLSLKPCVDVVIKCTKGDVVIVIESN